MFIETRQSRKGKQVDEETQIVIDKLQDSIQNSSESETFKSLFGKEKPGRVRCYGRTATPSMIKRNEEMSNMQKQHSNEMNSMKREMDGLKSLVRNMMKQQNPNLSEEELANMMAAALGSDNSAAPHSSASTHNPHLDEENEEEEVFQEGVDEQEGGRDIGEEEEEEYDE
ncbi:uncharacterized protein LOC130731992 [Lotus japonicus]|uniref:uncharacterized protein LOC130731992 n=1 Tax=Lotus japonicus TaxID=34305 RepID=UPI00258755C6|nr:uncharacterized protein LOC130731992 [Lotus japonicus]XP_057440122.1 uncharacterized protein LOC130731992 [Lotus japonicus]